MSNVSHNPDNRDPFRIFLGIVQRYPFAEGATVRPVFSRQRFVHDNNRRGIRVVGIIKKSSLSQRNLQGAKIIRRDRTNLFVRSRFIFLRKAALDIEGGIGVAPAQRQNQTSGTELNSGKATNPAIQLGEKINGAFAAEIS